MSNPPLPHPRVRVRTPLRHLDDDRPTVLGITGGIACGKSMIADLFRREGAALVSADILARRAVEPGSPVLAHLTEYFGAEILTPTGELDRPALARRIFAAPHERRRLEEITHPAIAALAVAELSALKERADLALVVYEAPLLFEAGAESRVDAILVVTVDESSQIERLCRRDGLPPDEALRRIRSQLPLCEKIARADIVLDNSGTVAEAAAAVRELYRALTCGRKKIPEAGDS